MVKINTNFPIHFADIIKSLEVDAIAMGKRFEGILAGNSKEQTLKAHFIVNQLRISHFCSILLNFQVFTYSQVTGRSKDRTGKSARFSAGVGS